MSIESGIEILLGLFAIITGFLTLAKLYLKPIKDALDEQNKTAMKILKLVSGTQNQMVEVRKENEQLGVISRDLATMKGRMER